MRDGLVYFLSVLGDELCDHLRRRRAIKLSDTPSDPLPVTLRVTVALMFGSLAARIRPRAGGEVSPEVLIVSRPANLLSHLSSEISNGVVLHFQGSCLRAVRQKTNCNKNDVIESPSQELSSDTNWPGTSGL